MGFNIDVETAEIRNISEIYLANNMVNTIVTNSQIVTVRLNLREV